MHSQSPFAIAFTGCLIGGGAGLLSAQCSPFTVGTAAPDQVDGGGTADGAIVPSLDGGGLDANQPTVSDSGCAVGSTSFFCDDFDTDPANAFARWSSVQGPGTLPTLTPNGFSAPNSMFVAVTTATAFLTKEVPKSDRLVVAFRVDMSGPLTGGELDILSVDLTQPNKDTYSLSIVRSDDGIWGFEEFAQPFNSGEYQLTTENIQKSFSKWSLVEVTCNLTAQHCSMTVDGMDAMDKTIKPPAAWTSFVVKVGAPFVDTLPNAYKINIDDVRIDK